MNSESAKENAEEQIETKGRALKSSTNIERKESSLQPLRSKLPLRMSQKLPPLKIYTSQLPLVSHKNMLENEEEASHSQLFTPCPVPPSFPKASKPNPNQPYPNGPVCIYPPNIYLYAKPTMPIIQSFDVVINVAKEVLHPFRTDGRHYRDSKHNLDIQVFDHIEYVHIHWDHDTQFALELDKLVSFVAYNAMQLNKKVLINCQMGISRSACLMIAFIMKTLNLNVSDAYEYVKERSPWIGPNMSLIFQLSEYQQIIRKNSSQGPYQSSSLKQSKRKSEGNLLFPEKPHSAQLPLVSPSTSESSMFTNLRRTRSSGSISNDAS